jgi:succinoglycan biosynthesis protein ExoV
VLYYCHTPEGNFGDDLNPWLWSRLAPDLVEPRASALFLGIGTLLSRKVPAEPHKFVLGSGCGYGRLPVIDSRWRIYGVRGPLTAARLHLDPVPALGDPAILVRSLGLPAQRTLHPVSFMPHHRSMPQADWPALCRRAGLHCIDPRGAVGQVLREIQQTGLLLAEAMHGAIVADALRVPWIPVRMYSHFLEFKWRDWTQSMEVPLRLAVVPPLCTRELSMGEGVVHALKKGLAGAGMGKPKWNRLPLRVSSERETGEVLSRLADLPADHPPCLSTDATLRRVEARLSGQLEELRTAWRSVGSDSSVGSSPEPDHG